MDRGLNGVRLMPLFKLVKRLSPLRHQTSSDKIDICGCLPCLKTPSNMERGFYYHASY